MKLAPTFTAPSKFNADDDVNTLKKASKSGNFDVGAAITLLTKRGMIQRSTIAQAYRTKMGRGIVDNLNTESEETVDKQREDVRTLLAALTRSYYDYFAQELVTAFSGVDYSHRCLLEILLTRFNGELAQIKKSYKTACNRELVDDVKSELSGDILKLAAACLEEKREEHGKVDDDKALETAKLLYNEKGKTLITDVDVIVKIFAYEYLPQLVAVAKQYHKLADRSLEDAIKADTNGYFRVALLMILDIASDRLQFYADSLYRSLHEADKCLEAVRGVKGGEGDKEGEGEKEDAGGEGHKEGEGGEGHKEDAGGEGHKEGEGGEGYKEGEGGEGHKEGAGGEGHKEGEGGEGDKSSEGVKGGKGSKGDKGGKGGKGDVKGGKGGKGDVKGGKDGHVNVQGLCRWIITRSELDLADIKSKYQQKYGKPLVQGIEHNLTGPVRQGLAVLVH